MLKPEHQKHIDGLQEHFNTTVGTVGMKHAEVARLLLAGTVKMLAAPDLSTVKTEQLGDRVWATFSEPIPDVPMLRTFKYRNPNNTATFDGEGRWTGSVAYFREWQGFISEAVLHVNKRRIHEASL